MLTYEVEEKSGDRAVLRLRGELAGDRPVHELHDALEHHYVDDGVRVIAADLAEVPSVTLEGIGMLLSLWRESQRRGKQFVVVKPTTHVKQRLAETGVARFLGVEK